MMQRLLALLLLLAMVTGCAGSAVFAVPHAGPVADDSDPVMAGQDAETLAVMTLNLAHGRGTGFSQLLQTGQTATRNLDRISDLIEAQGVQLVALQEADSESFWSGKFDHVDYLARDQRFNWTAHASHVAYLGVDYGTALLSRSPLLEPLSVRFSPGSGSLPKGFVVSDLAWPDGSGRKLTVVSLHLDPGRTGVRARQINELLIVLAHKSGPFVIMGDFNSDWQQRNSAVRLLSENLGLKAFDPLAIQSTFPSRNRRLDWILISGELEFMSYEVATDPVSDHRAVVARIAWPATPETS